MNLGEFVLAHLGEAVDFDGRYGGQCMDLYRQYAQDVLGFPNPPLVEGAADVWEQYDAEHWERISNEPYNAPEPGDVVIWSREVGAWGHIAVAVKGDTGRFWSFDQNWPPGAPCLLVNHSYHAVLGWLRPKVAPVVPEVTG